MKNVKPCKSYLRGLSCGCNDHCFNCARELSPEGVCPKGCGGGNDSADDDANSGDS